MHDLLNNIKLINRVTYLIGGLAVFILLFSCFDYAITNWFLITQITIVGDTTHITESQLAYIAKNRLQGNLFTLNIDGLREEFRQIPWVNRVTVSRDFPHAIVVGISEYQAIARLGDLSLITQDGKIFTGADNTESLPVFYVAATDVPLAIQRYQQLLPLIKVHNLALNSLTLVTHELNKLQLSNDLTVVICGDDVSSKFQLLNQYWDKLYSLNPQLHYVNLCYNNAMAISAKGE